MLSDYPHLLQCVLRSERKQTEKIRKDREKAAKLLEKDKNNQKLIANAQKTFDMEQIQIQAALKGKISEEERTRLLLMKAINEENGEEAKKLLEDLDRIQKQTLAIKSSLSSLKASNPFANWEEYTKQAAGLIAGLEGQLAAIYQRANDFLRIEKGVGAGIS